MIADEPVRKSWRREARRLLSKLIGSLRELAIPGPEFAAPRQSHFLRIIFLATKMGRWGATLCTCAYCRRRGDGSLTPSNCTASADGCRARTEHGRTLPG